MSTVRIVAEVAFDYEAGTGVIYAKVSPAGKLSEFRNDFSRFTTEQQPFIATRDDTAGHYALITVRSVGELRFALILRSVVHLAGLL